MGESAAAIFAKIAIEKGLLDEKQVEQARTMQRLARKDGQTLTIDKACVELKLLTPSQVKGLERGLKYYIVRKADKIYGKLAVQKKFVEKDVVENCLDKQKAEFTRKRLVRLSKLLMGLDAITSEEDQELRALVLKRLTPEESHHEATAVSEEEANEATGKSKGKKAGAKGEKGSRDSGEPAEEDERPAKKAFIVAPKNGSGRSSGERKAASESGRAAAGSGRKNIEVGKRSSASGRAGASEDAAKEESSRIPPRPVRPSKERRAITISSEDDLEAAPVLDILATEEKKAAPASTSGASDDTEKLPSQAVAKGAESGELSPPDASDERPAIPVPAPISASETTEGPKAAEAAQAAAAAEKAFATVAEEAKAAREARTSKGAVKPPAPEALAVDSKDEEFLLDDDIEVPAPAGRIEPPTGETLAGEAPKAGVDVEVVDWALPAKIGDAVDAAPASGANGAGAHEEEGASLASASADGGKSLKFSSADEP